MKNSYKGEQTMNSKRGIIRSLVCTTLACSFATCALAADKDNGENVQSSWMDRTDIGVAVQSTQKDNYHEYKINPTPYRNTDSAITRSEHSSTQEMKKAQYFIETIQPIKYYGEHAKSVLFIQGRIDGNGGEKISSDAYWNGGESSYIGDDPKYKAAARLAQQPSYLDKGETVQHDSLGIVGSIGAGYRRLSKNEHAYMGINTFYDYAWKYNNEPANEKNEKKKSDKLVKEISKVVYANGNEINEYVPRYTNSAINFTGDDIGSDHSMMIVLLYILIIILAFVFAVTINHTIVNEATAIGTLRAMGYSKKQLVVHYMALPIIISLMAAIIGNVLGYTIFKNVAAGMYYGSYSLTKYKTIWNAEAFILTTVVPLIIMLVINFITLMSKLSISPLKFIRKDLTRKKNRRALKLPNFKFITRFRLRIILQNKGNYITLFVGILFANIMLLFGMMMHPLLTHYQNEIVDNMIAKNQYVLKNSVQVKNKDAEKYSLTSLQITRRSLSEDISLYGIEEDSKYFKKNVENGMYISDGLSEKYKINKGDTFTLKDKYSGKKYKIKVAGVINYPGSLSVFMTRDKLNSLIDKDKNYFSGYFSNEKLSIDDKDVASVITEKDMTKTSRQLNVSMGNMFYLINVFAICLFVLLIYLLTKLIIEKNKNSISMVKILGYNNREIGKLYITATTWMVGLSIIISLILSTEIIDQIYFEMMKDYNGWLTLYLEQKTYVEMFIIGIVCYGIVAFFQFKKIKKIPMDNALKNVE